MCNHLFFFVKQYSVKSEGADDEFDGFELSEEQVNLLLDRVNVAAAAAAAAASGFDETQQQQQPFKLEDVKSEALALTSSHFVKYRLLDGKHVKTWQCAICKYCWLLK